MTTGDVAYVLTHYPRVAQTFIADEIEEFERTAGTITPLVINYPSRSDLSGSQACRGRLTALYLKEHGARIIWSTFRTFLFHPIQMAKLAVRAIGSAHVDPGVIIRRLVHLAFGAFCWHQCQAKGIRHFHAHFGQAPATIAWFAAEIGNFDKHETCTWSFTIHGFQDFVDERSTRLDLKSEAARFVVCVSDHTKSQLCRIADPDNWDRFHVIRCGIKLEKFPLRRPREMRAVPRVLVVGRLSPEKGHIILLHAAKVLRDQNIDLEIEIVGDGPFERQIRQHESRLGLGGRVLYSGELRPAEVSLRLAECDIFCLPSFSEGIPISIMEAMAVGVPVVTTYVGGIPELAVNNVTAMIVPASNTTALSQALQRVIEDAGVRERLVRNARAAVETFHSLERNVAELAALIAHDRTRVAASKSMNELSKNTRRA